MKDSVTAVQASRFQDEVVKASQPVVVDFYADWCGPCKTIEPVVHKLAEEYYGKVKFVKVDTDANQELAAQFGIMSIPTVMFFSKGKVEDIVIGAVPSTVLKSKVDALLKND
ncbi:MAG TPA: thioredoxin [Nitrososphaerales archaeon]|nr:thioredoxin [Nitrososphaerales archaeon]